MIVCNIQPPTNGGSILFSLHKESGEKKQTIYLPDFVTDADSLKSFSFYNDFFKIYMCITSYKIKFKRNLKKKEDPPTPCFKSKLYIKVLFPLWMGL